MQRVQSGNLTMLVALMAAAREAAQAARPTRRPAPWGQQPTTAPADISRIQRYLETGAGSVCRSGKASEASRASGAS